ncbi:hypothetical protein BKA23_0808 [Rudaeicoccus suwonensis]|uniref:Uncharacterized protein n=2 Tax=Rudaeicoccus suwonensis TaxID=657409 RepID=A0A561E8R9_9MICO|nr:hypothetical protein BKA23_0808 [Rudaeicoccus suwonensis]
MRIDRRDLLKVSFGGAAALALAACQPLTELQVRTSFDQLLLQLEQQEPELFAPTADATDGMVAWGTSYVLQALNERFLRTGRTDYADLFVQVADCVLNIRDSVLQRRDWTGKALPIWTVASVYTAMRANVTDATGTVLAIFALAPLAHAKSYTIHVLPGTSSFDVRVLDNTGKQVDSVTGLTMDPTSASYAPRVLRRRAPTTMSMTCQDVQRSGAMPVAQTVVPRSARVGFAVHTGMIASPLIEFSTSVAKRGMSSRYGADAARYARAAASAWLVHADEVTTDSRGTYVKTPRGTPVRYDGADVPHNQALALARLGLGVGAHLPSARTSATKIFQTFAADVRQAGAGLTWNYFWTKGVCYRGYSAATGISQYLPAMVGNHGPEDTSHGAIDVLAVLQALDAGIDLGKVTVASLQATLRSLTLASGFSTIVSEVEGSTKGARNAPLWSAVLPPDQRASYLMMQQDILHHAPPRGSDLLGAAYADALSPSSSIPASVTPTTSTPSSSNGSSPSPTASLTTPLND